MHIAHLFTLSGDTNVLPQKVKMHERRPSLDYHGERMHSEYNDDDEEYVWFVIHPLNDKRTFELFWWRFRQRSLWSDNNYMTTGDWQVQEHWEEAVHGPADHQWVWWVVHFSISI